MKFGEGCKEALAGSLQGPKGPWTRPSAAPVCTMQTLLLAGQEHRPGCKAGPFLKISWLGVSSPIAITSAFRPASPLADAQSLANLALGVLCLCRVVVSPALLCARYTAMLFI